MSMPPNRQPESCPACRGSAQIQPRAHCFGVGLAAKHTEAFVCQQCQGSGNQPAAVTEFLVTGEELAEDLAELAEKYRPRLNRKGKP